MGKGLILVASRLDQVEKYLEPLDALARQQLDQSWPGPTTWLIPHANRAPRWISGDHHTIAVRVSEHATIRQLCELMDSPIVSTSANPTGHRPASNPLQVRKYFGNSIDYMVPGQLGGQANPSEIRELHTNRIHRSG